MSWHASTDLLTRYARRPEDLDSTTASSVEAHLMTCATCRQGVAASADPAVVAASWSAIADVIDRPREGLLHRVLCRLGLSAWTVRLVAATCELRLGWAAAVFGSVALGVGLARAGDSPGPFLAVAPLVPLIAVWLAFAPIAEPAGEAGVAAPMSGMALVVRRVFAVEVPALVVVAAAAGFVPDASRAGMLWLLPGLALAAGSLALGTSVRMVSAVGGLALAWCALVSAAALPHRRSGLGLVNSALFGPVGQLAAFGALLLAAVVCWRRRDRFSTLEVTW